MNILALNDPRAGDRQLSGGKAARLALRMREGFRVPNGFILTTRAFEAFLSENRFAALVDEIMNLPQEDPENNIQERTRSLQERIRSAAIPAELAGDIETHLRNCAGMADPGVLWAVRSSAVAEDLENASFAGQYDTILGLAGPDEILKGILRCWASFFNDHAVLYRKRRKIKGARAAVIVQRLVDADTAGVCFSLDPVSGNRDRITVNANFGLGESVVSGKVTPDTFVVDRCTREVIHHGIASKGMRFRPAPGGAQETDIPEDERNSPCLSDAEAVAVAELALAVEAREERPVDIEWAIEKGRLYLLQSRPVTTAFNPPPPEPAGQPVEIREPEFNSLIDPKFPLYSNGNISEILPGCITPLSWDYVAPSIEHGFRAQGAAIGSMPPFDDRHPDYRILGFFYHRPYLCVSYMVHAAGKIPGVSPATILEEFVGPPETWSPAVTVRDRLPPRWHRLPRVVWAGLSRRRTVARQTSTCRRMVMDGIEEARDVNTWPDGRLIQSVRITPEWQRPSDIHIWASGFAVISFAVLRKLTARWLNDTDSSLAARLVTGIGKMPSADPAFGLFELARTLSASPDIQSVFNAGKESQGLYESLKEMEGADDFIEALNAFLEKHGHRAVCEAEFRNPCWREDPAQVLGMIRNYLHPDITPPEDVRRRQSAVRLEAEKELTRLSLPRRLILRKVLKDARKYIILREQLKDLIVWRCDRARRIYAEIRDRLVDRGLLARFDDIYFLVWQEVHDLLNGTLSPDDVARILDRRRKDFEWCRTVDVPKLQEGQPRIIVPEDRPDAVRLSGMGVSPGEVRGKARVILDPREDATIEPGEILVAPVTDAGWTPLFINAAALVVDVGGLLSHGSVVAREYGLPAAVGVSGATKQIKTGERIYVNGNTGEVIRLEA